MKQQKKILGPLHIQRQTQFNGLKKVSKKKKKQEEKGLRASQIETDTIQ